ncbi:MAG: TIGR01212 family radical SAM protein [Bacilli bacterium]|nr:TIGR01212 family radical SAM protein [Bacilli bacterium]
MKHLMNHEKHYVTLNNYLKDRFGDKVTKVSLNAGFTCPTRDGTKSTIGCCFCSKLLSGDFAGNVNDDLKTQFQKGVEMQSKKWKSTTYIAYLQAGSNTYAPIEKLRQVYYEVINLDENIKVLSIATRPDCINSEVVELLKEVNEKCEVWVELGFQTSNPISAIKINRRYSNQDFVNAVNMLNAAGIKVIAHMINGLPDETLYDMINTAKFLSQLDLFGIKIHMLHIMEGTPMAVRHKKLPYKLLTLDEYATITAEQLRLFSTSVVIHRLTGDAPKDLLLAPKWTLKKFVVLNEIDKYMRILNIYQGDQCTKHTN